MLKLIKYIKLRKKNNKAPSAGKNDKCEKTNENLTGQLICFIMMHVKPRVNNFTFV